MPSHLLLIDDNPHDRALVLRELRKTNPEAVVHEVSDAAQLQAVLDADDLRERLDVAITDYQLQWSTGLVVFRRLRERCGDLPVIMFTGSGNEELAVQALKEGVDDYITKAPGHYARVPFAVRGCVDRRRRQAEVNEMNLALRRHEARLELAMASGGLEAWEHDALTGTVGLSRRASQRIGRAVPQLSVEELVTFVHPDDADRVRRRLQDARDAPERFEIEFRVEVQGRERWLRAAAAPVPGEPHRRVGVLQDITPHKVREEELRSADRQKDEFIATLAHELRNPLAPIRYAADLLRPGATPHAVARAREVIERQAGTMARLLDDLLDVSRIALGRIVLRREPLDLREVVGRAVEDAAPAALRLRHRLAWTAPDAPVPVEGDAVRLQEVIDNLLSNAIKFTPPGGLVALRLEREGDEGRLCVSDNGIGIEASMLKPVFEPFVQASRPRDAGAASGLGIGLAVVRRLVELHGGRVEARSGGLGQGAEFEVRLPLTETRRDASAAASRNATARSPHRTRVLVVDDERDIAETLGLVLELEGHETELAFDGEAARAIAERMHPEVMVLDIGMPKMGGEEVAQWVRRQPWGATVRLVAVTGWGRDEDRRRTRDAGFDAHLVKPVDAAELIELVRQGRRATGPLPGDDDGPLPRGGRGVRDERV